MDLSRESSTDCVEILRSHDWTATPLGPIGTWPSSLRAAVDLMLPARAGIAIFMGPGLITLYNDAYAALIGGWHPSGFGRPAQDADPCAAGLEPLLRQVLATGEAVVARNRAVGMPQPDRAGPGFANISLSPLRGPGGEILGVFCILSETTDRMRAQTSESRLAAIVASTDAAILGIDLDMIVTSWNRGAELLYGYSAEEAIGMPVTRLLPPDRQDEETAIITRIQSGERVETHDTLRLHKSGHLLEVSLTVSPIHDETGKVVGASKISRDVSQRKAAERLQKVLVSEMKHRVKNTLATVHAIANQTLCRSSDRTQTFLGRISALSKSQDLITQGSHDGVEVMALMREIMAPFPPEQLDIRGPALVLGSNAALTFALALHELATNAAKYGALSVAGGRVLIAWELAGGEVAMVWRESGGPAVKRRTRKGFGSLLIERLLADTLGGEVHCDFRPAGLVCDIRAPLGDVWRPVTE